MTQQFGKHVFDQAGKLLKDAVVQKNFQALSENAVAASKGFYDQVTAAGLEQTKVLTDIADTAWDSTKHESPWQPGLYRHVELGRPFKFGKVAARHTVQRTSHRSTLLARADEVIEQSPGHTRMLLL